MIEFNLNNSNESIKILKKALKFNKLNSEILSNLGYVLWKNNELEEALVYINSAISINNKNTEALINKTAIYLELHKYVDLQHPLLNTYLKERSKLKMFDKQFDLLEPYN